MISNDDIHKMIVENNALWDDDFKHEAMTLLVVAFKKRLKLRNKLLSFILSGPPGYDPTEEDAQRHIDRNVYEKLLYLEESGVVLPKKGKAVLINLQKKYPQWKLGSDVDIAYPIIAGFHVNRFTVDEILLRTPEEAICHYIDYVDEIHKTRHDYLRTIGAACKKNKEWGFKFFQQLVNYVDKISDETISPLFFDISTEENTEEDIIFIRILITVIAQIIEKRYEAEFWKGLPNFLQRLYENKTMDITRFEVLAELLLPLFSDYDYNEKKESPGWFGLAINHPFGILTQTYLKFSHDILKEKKQNETESVISDKFQSLCDDIVTNYQLGSRYGLCVLCNNLSWFESVLPDWTQKKLIPLFLHNENDEQLDIVWSGYLHTYVISRRLIEKYDASYVQYAKKTSILPEYEKEGFISHVAGIMWNEYISYKEVSMIFGELDDDSHSKLTKKIRSLLSKAEIELAEKRLKNVIIPYWEWLINRHKLSKKVRINFWHIIPFSYGFLGDLIEKALKYPPASIKYSGFLFKDIVKQKYLFQKAEELIPFLVALLDIAFAPWQKDDWQTIWTSIKESNAKNLDELENKLAQKDIL